MFDLSRFSLSDMTRCGMELRRLGEQASGMEEVGERIVRYFYEHLRTPDLARPACVLVRVFVTQPFAALDEGQRAFVASVLGSGTPSPTLKCLSLLATAGDEPAWNSRHTSNAHKALPLTSEASVARSPMIAQLIRQLGVDMGLLLGSDTRLLLDLDQHTFNVFHVGEAKGSSHIPAQQQFVVPYDVQSVLGFGGLLPNSELFATILFTRVPVARSVADMFRPLALNQKLAMLPFVDRKVFA
jgi:two-component system NtrC family sensor kinase